MGALTRAIGVADQLLFALWRCAVVDSVALRVVLNGLFIVAVSPYIDVSLGVEISLVPALLLVVPDFLQPLSS